jgi:hypothetical protein
VEPTTYARFAAKVFGMRRKQAFRPHLLSFGAGLIVAFLIAIVTSAASPGLAVGVADNNAFEFGDPRGPKAAADLGLNIVRIFAWWKPGQTVLRPVQQQHIATAVASGRRVLVSVSGKPGAAKDSTITTAAGRRNYVATLLDLVGKFPAVRDVSIWNEPNYSLFWSSRTQAPQKYAALLAASYDALHFRGVRVYGFELHPSRQTVKWITGVGSWMRVTHRRRPLFDYVATHPYPQVNNEVPWTRHRQPGELAMGDVQRLRSLLRKAFSRTAQKRLEIMYTETGWTTAAFANGVTPSIQATRMVQALKLAYCQRGVHSFVTFLLTDAPDAWQTGLISVDWTARKPAYAPYKAAIARVRSRRVNCSQFPRAVL